MTRFARGSRVAGCRDVVLPATLPPRHPPPSPYPSPVTRHPHNALLPEQGLHVHSEAGVDLWGHRRCRLRRARR